MDQVLTVPQIQKLEKIAIEQLGIPSVVLMENAGRAVAELLLKSFSMPTQKKVVVVCGAGNNGGDGFVAARYLWTAGVNVEVMVCADIKHLKNDAKIFYRILKNLGVSIRPIKTINASFEKAVANCNVVVDALFGIGLARPLEGFYLEVVKVINDRSKKIWSVDIPSGLDGSTGEVLGNCLKATTTVSFSCWKKGFLINDGPRYRGHVEIVDIGIPAVLFRKLSTLCK